MLPVANHSDEYFLIQTAQGDSAAFSQLFKKYSPKIYSLALYLTKSTSVAEEIVQEVFIKVWENRNQLNDINSFNAWLRTVSKNICYNHLRKMANEKIALLAFLKKNSDAVSVPQDIVELKEFEAFIETAIQKLPPQQQKVFRLKKLGGKKTAEIAAELNISTHTVKEYLKIAQKTVRANVEMNISLAVLIAFA